MSDPARTPSGTRSLVHSVLVIVAAFAAGVALTVPATLVMGVLGLSVTQPSPAVFVTSSILQYVGFVAVAGGYLVYMETAPLVHVRRPTRRDALWVAVGLAALFVVLSILSAAIAALGVEQAENTVVTQGQQNPSLFLLLIPVTILFVAPGEELVYRGVVQGLFRDAYGPIPAIGVASVLFGISHYLALAGSGKLTYIVITVVLGGLLGLVYERTENILVPIGVHGLYNAILFASQWVVADPSLFPGL